MPTGITKRDYFASRVAPAVLRAALELPMEDRPNDDEIVKVTYDFAERMVRESLRRERIAD